MPGSVGFDENRLPPLQVEDVKWKRENLKVKVSLDLDLDLDHSNSPCEKGHRHVLPDSERQNEPESAITFQ